MLKVPAEEKENIYKHLKDLNICDRCILRYLGYNILEHGKTIFIHPEDALNVTFNRDQENCSEKNKKLKINPCRACLNLLQYAAENCGNAITDDYKKYDFPDFCTTANFPISVSLRELSMFYYLRQKFPDIYKAFNDIEKVKKIFRIVSSDLLAIRINRAFRGDSNFFINVNINYEEDEKEIEKLGKLAPSRSKKGFEDFLNNSCSLETFQQHYPVPPSIQDKEITTSITYSSSIVYLGGRYLKFSREMGQTPFIVKNIPIMEHSVQEVIFDNITKVLGCKTENLVFSSSGREDADTRMLCNGRPFYVQISEPYFEKVTSDQCRDIEAGIATSNSVVVIKLQQVFHNSIRKVKFGEEEKKKHYQALCKSLAPSIDDAIATINLIRCPLQLEQSTPIRVLHRRTHLTRKKRIFDIKASPVEGHPDLMCLDLVTDAGTYVKEFVNGDFQRTIPNITNIIGFPVDVVALDVTCVELEWP